MRSLRQPIESRGVYVAALDAPYTSNESGRFEVYVEPYPGPGARYQISTDGGDDPAWAGSVHRRSGTPRPVPARSTGQSETWGRSAVMSETSPTLFAYSAPRIARQGDVTRTLEVLT